MLISNLLVALSFFNYLYSLLYSNILGRIKNNHNVPGAYKFQISLNSPTGSMDRVGTICIFICFQSWTLNKNKYAGDEIMISLW